MSIRTNLKHLSIFVILTCFVLSDNFCQSASDLPINVFLKAKGTGQTTGHIANITVTNNSNEDLNTSFGPYYVPSDGKYQPYIIPTPIQIVAKANQESIVAVIGYCTDPHLPAPPAGHSLVAADQWDKDSPLIPITQKIISHTNRLQASGQIITPLSGKPEKEREVVIQQTLWWYSAGPSYNPCDHMLQSVTDHLRDTDWFPAFSDTSPPHLMPQPLIHDYFALPPSDPWFAVLKGHNNGAQIYNTLSQGIAQIADAITKVGHAAGLADFSQPKLPAGTGKTSDAMPSSHPQIANNIKITGTGRTTGHIADLTVSNPTKEPINVRIGNGEGFLIPSNGKEQPYIVPSLPIIPIESGKSVTVPVIGYCVDVRRPPVALNEPMPKIQNWVTIATAPPMPNIPAPSLSEIKSPKETIAYLISIPTKIGLSLDEAKQTLQSLPLPAAQQNWNCPLLRKFDDRFPITVFPAAISAPRTVLLPRVPDDMQDDEYLIPASINVDEMPALATPILLAAIHQITETVERIHNDETRLIKTPFANNKPKEREAVIQQTFWIYSAGLSGQPYTKKDFEANTIQQFAGTTGKDLPQNQKDQIDKGVDDFWNTFSAVGVEAKILPKPIPSADDPIKKQMEDAFGSLDKAKINIHKDEIMPGLGAEAVAKGNDVAVTPVRTPSTTVVAEEVAHSIQKSTSHSQNLPESLVLQSNETEKEPMAYPVNTACDCKEMTFNLVVKGQNSDRNKKRDNRPVSSGQESLTESENEKALIFDDWSQGDYYTINFNTFKMKCDCQNAGVIKNVECDFFPGKNKSTVTDKDRIKLESKPEKIDKKVFEIISENDGAGQKYEYKYTPQKDQPDSFTFCFSAYCKSDKCNEKENGISCGPYCITLKFRKRE